MVALLIFAVFYLLLVETGGDASYDMARVSGRWHV